jgi:Putative zinc-finger
MSQSCAGWRGDMGAYLVGALDGEARARLIRHLETCAGCRMDYDDLVPVRGLLSQLAGPGGAARDGEPGESGYGERAPGGPPLPALRPVRGGRSGGGRSGGGRAGGGSPGPPSPWPGQQ